MAEHPLKPKRRLLGFLLALVVCIALAFAGLVAYVYVLQGPQVPGGPLRMVRGPNGRLAPPPQPEPPGVLGFQALAARTRCSDSLSASASTEAGPVARFACRRVLILNRSSHLLMQRMGPRLLDQLAGLEGAREIDYAPDGRVQETDGLAPDVVITLDMPSVHESDSLGGSKLRATIVCTAGSSLAAGRTERADNLTPPCLRFRWTATLDHRSVTKGIAARAARYMPQAEDIAQQLGAALVKLLNGYLDRYGPLPDLPAAFYPPFSPADAPPVPDGCALELVASWHGLMAGNDTYWRLAGPATLRGVQRALAAGGWHIDSADGPHEELQAARGAETLSVFPQDPEAAGGPFYVHFLRRISHAGLSAAIDSALAGGTPADTLLLFSKSWSKTQRRRALDLLRGRPLTNPDAYLSLAEVCRAAGRRRQARKALACAAALTLVAPDAGALASRARSVAASLSAGALLAAPPNAATMTAAGFVLLPSDGQTIERKTTLDVPVLFFIKDAAGGFGAVSVRVVQSAAGTCRVAYAEADAGSKSWGGGDPITAQQPAHLTLLDGRVDVTVRRQPATGSFVVAARLLTSKTHHNDTTNTT